MCSSIREEIKDKLPKIATNLALALTFAMMNIIVSPCFSSVSRHLGLLTWIALMFVTGIFLVRALVNCLAISDKATRLFLKFLGIREEWSRRRALKDLIYIVAIILTAAAVYPLFEGIRGAGNALQTITTYVALALIFLFVYDIGRTLYRISEEKAEIVANWLVQRNNKETSK
jgi:hypothetical protein